MDRVLYIGPKEREAIDKLVDFAEKHRINKDLMQKSMKREWAAGDDPNYICYIEAGYRIVYSIEEQPIGWCRHLSVSVDDPQKSPHPMAVEMLMKEFGFRGGIQECINVWIEENVHLSTGQIVNAVNALQEYNGPDGSTFNLSKEE